MSTMSDFWHRPSADLDGRPHVGDDKLLAKLIACHGQAYEPPKAPQPPSAKTSLDNTKEVMSC